jgi:hypothetical protein
MQLGESFGMEAIVISLRVNFAFLSSAWESGLRTGIVFLFLVICSRKLLCAFPREDRTPNFRTCLSFCTIPTPSQHLSQVCIIRHFDASKVQASRLERNSPSRATERKELRGR